MNFQDIQKDAKKVLSLVPGDVLHRGILVAVSGGSDSVALMRILALMHAKGELSRVEVASVDHGIRPDSWAEVERVREWAAALGLEFHTVSLNLGADASEEQARSARRAFLEHVLEKRGLGVIATGHTMDDQSETVVMRLIRGAGTRGLGAMEPYSNPYVRPLLSVRRARLREFLESIGQEWVEDPSNDTTAYFRNRVRHDIIPLMERDNPRLVETLHRTAMLLRMEHQALERMVHALVEECSAPMMDGVLLDASVLGRYGEGAVMVAIRQVWRRFVPEGTEISMEHVLSVMNAGDGARVNLPGRVVAVHQGRWIYLGPVLETRFSKVLHGPGRVSTPFGSFELVPDPCGEIHISQWPVTVRTVNGGDAMMRGVGHVKVKNLYGHVPGPLRRVLLGIEEESRGLVWVEGIGPAKPFLGGRYCLEIIDDFRIQAFELAGIDRRVKSEKCDTA